MRVSSAAMTSALLRMSSARSVTSRRLPIGVATTYNDPGSARNAAASSPAPPPFGFPILFSVMRNLKHDPQALRYVARRILRAGVIVMLTAGALSCAEIGPATRMPTAGSHPAAPTALPPTGIPAGPSAPATTSGEPSGVAAGMAQPPAGAGQNGQAASGGEGAERFSSDVIPPPPTSDRIALILPLDVPEFERAAAAVRDGFLDAATAANAKNRVVIIAHGVDGVIPAFETARQRGVSVAVGPLVRDDLKTLVLSGAELPWTLALNQLEGSTPLPRAIYTFSL